MSIASKFKDGVEVVLICEVAVGLDDVGVVEEALDLEFADELHQQVVLQDLLLVHHLQRHDHTCKHLPRQVHYSELALSQSPDYLEVLTS